MDYLALLIGLAIGVLLGFLLARVRAKAANEPAQNEPVLAEARAERDQFRAQRDEAHIQLASLSAKLDAQKQQNSDLAAQVQKTEQRFLEVDERRTRLESKAAALGKEVESLTDLQHKLDQDFAQHKQLLEQTTIDRDAAREKNASLDASLTALQREFAEQHKQLTRFTADLAAVTTQRADLETKNAALSEQIEGVKHSYEERMQEIKSARDHLVATFKSTAAQILQETKEQNVKEHQERLGTVLGPFKDQLKGFQELVSKTYSEEGRERVALKKEIELLAERHQSLTKEAERLTNALTGNSKTRGDWGEITLRRILEKSGLREGQEFRLQESSTQADGSRLRPDVVISLPEDGALVIDSKVQLTAWTKVSNANNSEEAKVAAGELVSAVRSHMRDLDKKAYSDLYAQSVDMVVMYIPIDAAVMAALANAPDLYDEAYQRGVVLTGPTMLMALLGSLAHQWRGKQQEQNVLRIAKIAESLGRKLELFLNTYQSIGQRLRQGAQEYNKGLSQISLGPGNVLRKARDLGELGIKSAKKIKLDWESISVDVATESHPTIKADDTDANK
jgi:DNA recombination protein RmuC